MFRKLRRCSQRHQQSSVHVVSRWSIVAAEAPLGRTCFHSNFLIFSTRQQTKGRGAKTTDLYLLQRGRQGRDLKKPISQRKKLRSGARMRLCSCSEHWERSYTANVRFFFSPTVKNPSLLGPTMNFFVCLKLTILASLLVLCSFHYGKFLSLALNKTPCVSSRRS